MGYTIIGWSTVGIYEEHTNDIIDAYNRFKSFMLWANRVEIYDHEFNEVFDEWERED